MRSSRHWLRLPSLAETSTEETLVLPQIEGGVYWGPVSWLEEGKALYFLPQHTDTLPSSYEQFQRMPLEPLFLDLDLCDDFSKAPGLTVTRVPLVPPDPISVLTSIAEKRSEPSGEGLWHGGLAQR